MVGPHRGRKAASGGARYVSVASGVHGDAVAVVVATPPEVRGVEGGGTEGIEHCHEGVGAAAEGRLVGPRRRRKAAGGVACHVGVASGVHGDTIADVKATPSEVRGIEEGGTEGIEHCHEGVGAAAEGRLVGPRRRRKAAGGEACHVGVTSGVHGDAVADVTATAPEVRGVR